MLSRIDPSSIYPATLLPPIPFVYCHLQLVQTPLAHDPNSFPEPHLLHNFAGNQPLPTAGTFPTVPTPDVFCDPGLSGPDIEMPMSDLYSINMYQTLPASHFAQPSSYAQLPPGYFYGPHSPAPFLPGHYSYPSDPRNTN
jgi:hypothetical protein